MDSDASTRDIRELNEAEVRSRFITPAIVGSGWSLERNVREEFAITAGRIDVRGSRATRRRPSFADYVLTLKPGIPLAVVEAKDANHPIGGGMQQALGYAERPDAPFAFSSNGRGFVFHDRTGVSNPMEREIGLDEFPSPSELRLRWECWKDLPGDVLAVVEQEFLLTDSREPRSYQVQAVNRAVDAVARGQDRVLLVMATGTGKTYTAFQIIWRLWKAQRCRRILFLADRNILVDQTKVNDFKPFGRAMTKITGHEIDPAYEIYLSLYQAITGSDEESKVYRKFSPDFFDLIVVDECHRGSAADDAAWKEILDYFTSAVHLGMTATPKETKDVSNITYFGEPVFTDTAPSRTPLEHQVDVGPPPSDVDYEMGARRWELHPTACRDCYCLEFDAYYSWRFLSKMLQSFECGTCGHSRESHMWYPAQPHDEISV